jgi:hypothetical protein
MPAGTVGEVGSTYGDLLAIRKDLLSHLRDVKLEPRDEFNWLVLLAETIFHNEIRDYADTYLIPNRQINRRHLVVTEEALREARQFLSTGFADTAEHSRHNLTVFGSMLEEILDAIVKSGVFKEHSSDVSAQ